MNNHKSTLYRAALLHDIGKFWQRTYLPDAMKEFGPGIEKHPILSEKYAKEWLGDDNISFIVANHHEDELKKATGTPLQLSLAALACEGDTLASGTERERDDLPYRRFFHAILSKVRLQGQEQELKNWKQTLCRLTALGYEFPFEENNPGDKMTIQYRNQWEHLKNESGLISKIHPDSLLYLSKKYLWCVPSAFYKNVPDISLHEHSRLTAAIALCLHDYFAEPTTGNLPENLNLKTVKDARKELSYLLVCGDITGIQKYIYNIAHSGAMKALKGRSFWLQQIVDTVAFRILEECGLFHCNLLFSTGGKFCLLLPNTAKVKVTLDDIVPSLERELGEIYDNNLALVFGRNAVSGDDILHRINDKWAELFRITDAQKTKKYADSITSITDFFKPGKLSGELMLCQATKTELFEKKDLVKAQPVRKGDYHKYITTSGTGFEELDENNLPTGIFISPEQHNAIQVGRDIRDDKHAIIRSKSNGYEMLGWERIDFLKINEVKKEQFNSDRIFYLNTDEHLSDYQDKSIVQGWRFYGGDWKFKETFEELIEGAYRYPRLGILRMDVDNLGHVFHKGLKRPAFSRIVQLSTMMDFFFSCYLNKLKTCWWCLEKGVVETEFEADGNTGKICLKNAMNIVYAGGDDLFIVGIWNVLPDVARWIRQQFKAFTCNNPNLTISAGIALFENKFPLYKAAKYAADALDKAKSWKMPGDAKAKKDSICFLSIPMRWEDFEIVHNWAIQWAGWIGKKQMSKGFLSMLDTLYADFENDSRYKLSPNPYWGRWRWRSCYFLTRFADRMNTRGDEELEKVKEEIKCFSSQFFVNHFEQFNDCKTIKIERNCIDILPVAVRWADFLTRTKSEE